MNIVNCALLSAFVLSMPKRPDVKRLTAHRISSGSTRLLLAARIVIADIRNERKCR